MIKLVLSEVITTGQLRIGREQEVVNLKTIYYDRLRTQLSYNSCLNRLNLAVADITDSHFKQNQRR